MSVPAPGTPCPCRGTGIVYVETDCGGCSGYPGIEHEPACGVEPCPRGCEVTHPVIYPVGTQVRYWPGIRSGEGLKSVTSTPVWLVGGHTPCVSVEGYPGGIALTHVESACSDPPPESCADAECPVHGEPEWDSEDSNTYIAAQEATETGARQEQKP